MYATRHYHRVLEINHPLIHSRPAQSSWRLYVDGSVVEEGRRASDLPEPVRFCFDVLLTLWWSLRKAPRAEIFVGLGVLNGASGVIARFMGIVRDARAWMIDFSPHRFPSDIMSAIFRAIDGLVAWRSDETWNITEHIIEQHRRARLAYALRRRTNTQKVVPIGVDRLAPTGQPRVSDRIVFVGHVLEKQGLQLVIEALPQVLARRPDAHLIVVGDGPYLPELKRRTKALHLDGAVEFRGFVDSDDEVWTILGTASIGVATYLHATDSFTYFADPGKIKLYAAAGLPMCLTSVPSIAAQIADASCGIVVDDEAAAIGDGILRLLEDPALEERRVAAIAFASAYSWDRILESAFDIAGTTPRLR